MELKEQIYDFIRAECYDPLVLASTHGKPLVINFANLDKFAPEIGEKLLESPEEYIALFEEVVEDFDLPKVPAIQFRNLPKNVDIRIRNLRVSNLEKFITVDGVVKIASDVKPRIYMTLHECQECGNVFEQEQRGSAIVKPFVCPNCGRREGSKLVEKKMYDSRWLTVGEPFEITTGEKPGELKVFLRKELTTPDLQRKSDPGNRIIITGILKELPRKLGHQDSTQTDIYLEANYVEPAEEDIEDITISKDDEGKILALSKDPDVVMKLVRSMAPSIYGNDEIKEAVLMQLFGGVPMEHPDGTRIRGDIHILLVGDPATAKSQLLKLTSRILPRSKYVSGKGVSGAGLISTVRKDEFTGGWVLEAGALVLCNHGLLAIDEFEKMAMEDIVSMHEALEQGTVSIAKASIVATLPAQTTVLAGANPKLGRFNIYTPISEQITVPTTIMSRFDLKFVLRDVPNPEMDEKLVSHVLKLRSHPEEIITDIDHVLLRKYVVYARRNVRNVKLGDDALAEFKRFFVEMRGKYTEDDQIVPITFRQFEGLMRIAQASAKVHLRDYTTKEDADRAIKLMQVSLRQLGFDPEMGKLDIDRVESSVSGGQRSKMKILMDLIERMEKDSGAQDGIPMEDLEAQAEEEGIQNWSDMVQKMINEGVLYKPRSGFIKKI
ncbi:MAG: minichromosome maintenance protein MCM [Candidatus Aenigmarchaeota archaeon]|nr:minichromosome maintenance protein MCM [Candidatus Aenigmarchaeota archaeon]